MSDDRIDYHIIAGDIMRSISSPENRNIVPDSDHALKIAQVYALIGIADILNRLVVDIERETERESTLSQ